MAMAMLPHLKQSRLGFNAHSSEGASSSRAPMMEVIVLDDSSDDELKTPPPSSVVQGKKAANTVDKAVGSKCKTPGNGLLHKRNMSLQTNSDISISQPPAKRAKADDIVSQDSHTQLLPDSEPDPSFLGESRMCHQHRRPCSKLLQCTVRKERGYRCTMKYCYTTLAKVYKQDASQIVSAGRNIPGAKVEDHVGPAEASYLWKCPKCRGVCQCSACRKRAGLEPLGIINANGESLNGMRSEIDVELVPTGVQAKGKSKEKEEAKGKEKDGEIAAKSISKEAKGPVKARGRPKKVENASLKNSFAKAAETTQQSGNALAHRPRVYMQQQTLPQPLHKPMEVEKPTLTSIRTRLPIANIKERMWLYESLVRFDWFEISKTILKNLDRFDDWTEGHLQTILEKLICRAADIGNIKNKPSRKIHQKLVSTFQEFGQDIKRGEAWEAAKKYCTYKNIKTATLQDVPLLPHQIFDEKKSRQVANVPTETLLEGRMTRGRRLAQQRAVERAKIISMKEMQDSDESSLSSMEEESEADSGSESVDEEEEVVTRRSRRLNKGKGDRKTRSRGKVALPPSESNESEEEDEVPAQANESKSESDSDVEIIGEIRTDGPREAPPFEERVAILSGLVEVLMEKKAINEEITSGFKEVILLEKAGKEEERELIAEQAQILQAHSNKAPSMLEIADFAAWKEEKNTLMKKHAFDLMDIKVHTYLQIEAHKSRSGPLGKDADGNEYWQLSEYNEFKPVDVTGRWAWSLLVLGSDFYKTPLDPPEESKEDTPMMDATDDKQLGIDEGLDEIKSAETSIDEDFVVLINVPTSRKSPVQKSQKEETKAESGPSTPIKETSAIQEIAKKGVEGAETFGFSCTDDHLAIARLKEYVLYRLASKEYEEMLEARTAEQLEKEQMLNASIEEQIHLDSETDIGITSMTTGSTMRAKMSERKRRKAEMMEKHSSRRKEVENLLSNLEMVRMYHQWHSTEEEKSK